MFSSMIPDTLFDRAALGSGRDFSSTKAVGDIPSIWLLDGPHGLRKQAGEADSLGVGASIPATCFPPAVGLGQSWDPELAERIGQALGDECQASNVHVLLGPGINIKRSPLGGRNFEYFSEDPLVGGVLGSAWIRGLQSRGVGASLKHFALYNQEADRMRVSCDVDARPLREIYLRGFRRAVTEAQPWTVMSSYNRVNGVPASQNSFLLTQVLRNEWGFEGAVVSDWASISDRVAAVAAGLDLQMPDDGDAGDSEVVAAVEAGVLDEEAVERSASAVAALARRGVAEHLEGVTFDLDAHHALAREAATRSIVLLQNNGSLLPLVPSGSLAVIGEFARTPHYQGGGSSHVNPSRLDLPIESIRTAAPGADVSFAAGFLMDGSRTDAALIEEAVAAARAADVAILFLGPDARQQSEGFDRTDLELGTGQLELLAAVADVQSNIVVVLSHGGPLRLAEVVTAAPAILDGALLGQAGGSAIADVLFGTVNPSGKLTETVPVRIEDTPAFLDFPGERQHVRYGEGLFVGYRWYDARHLDVMFPFGHGLSYTTFDYSTVALATDGDDILATFTVTNSGDRSGREIVQSYVSVPGSKQVRVPLSLGGFASVELDPGESKETTVRVERAELEYWDVELERFVLEPGTYEISVGASSRDLRQSATIDLIGEPTRIDLTLESTIGEVMENPVGAPLIQIAMKSTPFDAEGSDALGLDLARMLQGVPIYRLVAFSGGKVTRKQLDKLVEAANAS
jgi:beta-glucosidase